jgi:hypothetical protein
MLRSFLHVLQDHQGTWTRRGIPDYDFDENEVALTRVPIDIVPSHGTKNIVSALNRTETFSASKS